MHQSCRGLASHKFRWGIVLVIAVLAASCTSAPSTGTTGGAAPTNPAQPAAAAPTTAPAAPAATQAPAKPAASSTPIKIGAIYPRTGIMAVWGEESYRGADLARELFNKQGGVNGRPVEYTFLDAPDANAATSAAERLITKDNLQILVGSFSSTLAVAISSVAERNKVLFWETNAVADEITQRGFKYTFRLTPMASGFGENAISALLDIAPKLNLKPDQISVAMIHGDDAYSKQVNTAALAAAKKAGIKVVVDQAAAPSTTDFTPVVLPIKQANPTAVISTWGAIGVHVQVLDTMRNLQLSPQAIVLASGIDQFLIDKIGADANGIILSDFPALDMNPKGAPGLEEFTKEYSAKYGPVPGPRPLVAYSSMQALFKVMKEAKDPASVDSLREAALKMSIPKNSFPSGWGLRFPKADDPNAGQNLEVGLSVTQVQQGKFRTVWPAEVASAQFTSLPLAPWGKR